ncbi:ClpA/ClpB-like protein [Kribbella orskensis]|uniref:ClpA/ClpB-like protein n=1 Tax=Kribbella orskensis TaxID=2512216 RepID=A0ABY2B8D9_9ACTN|nr:ClpA/ClpB-like protein [Kribbella sp. VKM Ac-2500]TCO11348.1 ClpA/ClpB-like protein [Kribbella orskensis]
MDRLTPAARRVMVAAQDEAEGLGHGYIGDEHVLLGLLGDDAGSAQRFLRDHGLDLAAARTDLLRLTADGRTPQSRGDDAATLRAVGIDVGQVEHQLKAAFGPDAVAEAVWRASRRPWWRGGGRRRNPLCGKPFFAKRALALAVESADRQGRRDVDPEHLLYGVLLDAADPFGTGLGRRGRKRQAQLGWRIGTCNPAAAILAAHGLDPGWLRAQLSADMGSAP